MRREPAVATRELLERVSAPRFAAPAPLEDEPQEDEETLAERQERIDAIFTELMADPEAAFRPVQTLYQDFLTHCRLKRLSPGALDLAGFRRKLALARAGVGADGEDEAWTEVVARSEELPEDMQGVYLLLAKAARDAEPCPGDEVLARAYGSHSPSRGRFLLTWMAERGYIAAETDFRGNRVVTIAGNNWRTGAGSAKPRGPAAAPRLRRVK